MISKGRKMLAVGVVLGLCAVAMIGAAYAAFGGSARTYNEGNNATAGYMTMTPDGNVSEQWTAISAAGSADLTTYTFKHTTSGESPVTTTENAYYMTGATVVNIAGDDANGYAVKSVVNAGKTYTVDNQTGETLTALTLTVTAKAGTTPAGVIGTGTYFKYFVKVTIGSSAPIYKEISTTAQNYAFTNLNIGDNTTATVTVDIVYGYIAGCYIPDDGIGDVKGSTESGYTQAAIMTSEDPADMVNMTLAFSLAKPA